jgi:diacylglycerol O-acyltransferase / wax synthase
MTGARLSALDASFLAVETPTAHMHVGWVAVFSAPPGERLPGFPALREHIERRLVRAPRYRQMLAPVPLGVHPPEWVDDQDFSVDRHVYWAPGPLREVVGEVMSMPLRRDRPLWEMWICESPSQREFAIVGKAHHCMVDGIAAVELGSLLLDATPDPPADECVDWRTGPPLSPGELLGRALRDLLAQQLSLLDSPLSALRTPTRAVSQTTSAALRVGRALAHSLRAAPTSVLNRDLSPRRRLGWAERPLADLRTVKRTYGTTVNNVMLAAVAGGMRTYMLRHGEHPSPLKAMVPVNIRSPDDVLGNRLSFVFVELPCDEPYPLKRLHQVHASMTQRKRDGEPEGTDLALKAAEHTPPVVQHAISRMVASPRTFNLVVSNIPGPTQPLYILGCPLRSTYPIVPLSDQHAVSVGMTTVRDRACFGVYADPEVLPDTDALAHDIDREIDELLTGARGAQA